MNINHFIQTVGRIQRGAWFKIVFTSDVPVKAAFKNQYTVCKKSIATIRWGIKYKNMASVQTRMGEAIKNPLELPWGQWSSKGPNNMLIEHKGKYYLRAYNSPNKPKVVYYVNGNPVSLGELQAMGIITPSYFKNHNGPKEVFTINVENIEQIG